MSGSTWVLGVDPGPHVGLALLRWRTGPLPANLIVDSSLFIEVPAHVADGLEVYLTALSHVPDGIERAQVEAWAAGPRSARLSTPKAAKRTRETINRITAHLGSLGIRVVDRRAADVMSWASDRRLDDAGLLIPTRGKRHARAAARHALYCSVRDLHLPDPLMEAPR